MTIQKNISQVYFSKTLEPILNLIQLEQLGNNIAIKVHFGERGCITYLSPEIVKKLYNYLISKNKKATLVETNVLYRGSRTNSIEHLKTAKEHGFDFAPIDLLDGEYGQETIEIKLEKGLANPVKLGKGLEKYDSMIVLTHFKGHMATGFGGAIKNIGMGLGSRAGKLHMHSNQTPFVIKEKCNACQICIQNCNFNSIKIEKQKAKINPELCSGCAMCIAICPQKAIQNPWDSSSEDLQKKIVDYAEGALKIIPKTIYINVLQNITESCDCDSRPQKPIMQDIGLVYSKNLVAIDKASLDLANKKSNNQFNSLNQINNNIQINYAEEKKLGNKEYSLIEV